MAAPLRLLLVEDDVVDCEAVRRLLGDTYATTDVGTGREALKSIEQSRPDAVLLDYHLPDGDGVDLVPYFVERLIPVILLTAEGSPELIVEAMQRGAQDYLIKAHLERLALARAIDNAIEKVALKRDLVEQQVKLAEQAAALDRSHRQVRALASALTLVEQRERRRIAQILHDHVQQMLYGIQMRTYLIGLDLPEEAKPKMQEHLAEMDDLLNEAIQSTRTLTVELSPPVLKSEGLAAAFAWLAAQMHKVHDLRVDLDLRCDPRMPSEDLRVLVFQLVRELLFNVVKHAQSDSARLGLFEQDGSYVLEVADTGIGFDAAELAKTEERQLGGFGLHSIRERLALFGGDLTVESSKGQGTRVRILLPNQVEPQVNGGYLVGE
ncbi:MAG: response regulator [Caldilineaceae bacterium]|nr:response regulator [Caldilineaceae bacterium]